MNVIETWISGVKVFGNGKVSFSTGFAPELNNFNCSKISTEEIKVLAGGSKVKVIEAFDGELFTKRVIVPAWRKKVLCSDTENDILKIVLKERYNDSPPAIGFIKGFNLKRGAFASSVAHDSHNIICMGVSDNDIVNAINEVVEMRGGLAVCTGDKISKLKLEIGGIMTSASCVETAENYLKLNNEISGMGCRLKAPFMTLSFMALLVIPELKIGDKGLFDVVSFSATELFLK
jgi:adenine deaminase